MRGDEILPCSRLAPFRSWSDSMPAKHVSDRLVRDFVAEISERFGDPVVTPAGVLTRHLENQALYVRLNLGPPRVGPVLRAIELLLDSFRHQPRIVSGLAS